MGPEDKLVESEHQGTGRARPSSLHARGVGGEWVGLSEGAEYLWSLDALEETDPKKPTGLGSPQE